MDGILEFILELIFEIVFEGSLAASSSRRVPMLLRVLAGAVAGALFLGVVFILVFVGIMCFRDPMNLPVVGVGLILLAVLFVGTIVYRFAKTVRGHSGYFDE